MFVCTYVSTYNVILLSICVPQGLALKENNISRYNAEFHEVSKIGSGQFGTVYKCINRLGTYVRMYVRTYQNEHIGMLIFCLLMHT